MEMLEVGSVGIPMTESVKQKSILVPVVLALLAVGMMVYFANVRFGEVVDVRSKK
jgi:hypothetical protein